MRSFSFASSASWRGGMSSKLRAVLVCRFTAWRAPSCGASSRGSKGADADSLDEKCPSVNEGVLSSYRFRCSFCRARGCPVGWAQHLETGWNVTRPGLSDQRGPLFPRPLMQFTTVPRVNIKARISLKLNRAVHFPGNYSEGQRKSATVSAQFTSVGKHIALLHTTKGQNTR